MFSSLTSKIVFFIHYIRKIAFKYEMEESIFRMKKRACDYEKTIKILINDEDTK